VSDWGSVVAFHSSNIVLNGGVAGDSISAMISSTITMNGGTFWTYLAAHNASTITIVGRNFAVDGVPVPYAALTAQTGTLTGTLASGDPINNVFYQGGYDAVPPCTSSPCTGTITLAPPDHLPTLSPWSQLALMAGLLGAGLGVWRGRAG
jgi:hypothetical protein